MAWALLLRQFGDGGGTAAILAGITGLRIQGVELRKIGAVLLRRPGASPRIDAERLLDQTLPLSQSTIDVGHVGRLAAHFGDTLIDAALCARLDNKILYALAPVIKQEDKGAGLAIIVALLPV